MDFLMRKNPAPARKEKKLKKLPNRQRDALQRQKRNRKKAALKSEFLKKKEKPSL